MGLDMYFQLKKEQSVFYSRWDRERGVADKTNYPKELSKIADYIGEHNFKGKMVETYYEAGYFRKFNALHCYIVDHFADGVDECQKIYISKERINELLNILKEIQADHSKATELLPCGEGCFFGSQEYDDWYFNDVDNAVEMFEMILAVVDLGKYELIYQASW